MRVMEVLFVAKSTKITGLRSIAMFYYKDISGSEHKPRLLKIKVKCDPKFFPI